MIFYHPSKFADGVIENMKIDPEAVGDSYDEIRGSLKEKGKQLVLINSKYLDTPYKHSSMMCGRSFYHWPSFYSLIDVGAAMVLVLGVKKVNKGAIVFFQHIDVNAQHKCSISDRRLYSVSLSKFIEMRNWDDLTAEEAMQLVAASRLVN